MKAVSRKQKALKVTAGIDGLNCPGGVENDDRSIPFQQDQRLAGSDGSEPIFDGDRWKFSAGKGLLDFIRGGAQFAAQIYGTDDR